VEEPLRGLDIASDTQRVEVGISHPWWRTPARILNLGVLGSWSQNTTTLLGEPFSFSAGAVRGESRVSAVRLFQEYLDRGGVRAFALRSVFSVGVDALDATIHDHAVPDSRFFVWLGQGQYIRNLDRRETQLVLRAAIQWTPDVLLPLERYAVGGVATVRGYRENELVGDSGYVASVELRYPLWRGALWRSPANLLQVAVFTDFGSAWGHGLFDRRQDLFSAGAGLRLNMNDRLRAEFYLAHAFEEPLPKDSYDWQDDGIHFMVETEF
jgi:hemolysin activation/secretion protein